MMLLTTFSFFLSSLLPLLLPTHGSRLFLQIFLSVYVCGKDVAGPRCGGESDVRADVLHHHSVLEYIHRRSHTLPYEQYQATTGDHYPLLLAHQAFSSPRLIDCFISTTCLEPPDCVTWI
uniref:Secreted protein n=1 Tax=Brassica campestris TaxID=3711 RepID=A0A3P6C4Y9_BRACM|nr:unnamed protein product [Brassica rapa]